MSYEFFVGFRYLKAKRKMTFLSLITFISIAGIALGVMALIIVLAVMSGFGENLRDKILGTYSHIVVNKYGKEGIKDYSALIEEIKKETHVIGAAPFIFNQVMLTFKGNVSGVVLRAIDPKLEGTVTDIEKYLSKGKIDFLEFQDSFPVKNESKIQKGRLDGIIIGKELSQHLDTSLGDKINVVSPIGKMTPIGMVPRIKKFRVVGIFDSGMYEYDSSLAFISLKSGQKFFKMGDVVSGIEVKVDKIYSARDIAEKLQKRIGFPYYTRDWIQMNKNLFSALKMEKIAMFIILTLIVLVAAFNIISTLIMVVMDKSRDIAILKSMGATNGSILKIFSIEGLIIGLVGTILGVAGGFLVVPYLNEIVGFTERLFSVKIFPSDVYYLDKLPAKINYFDTGLIVSATILISFLATLYPAWRASKLDPVEALRYE